MANVHYMFLLRKKEDMVPDSQFSSRRDELERDLIGSPARDNTSLGDVSVQFRRAAEALGYDRQKLTSFQRGKILAVLDDPQTGIFIAAKHLSDLRNIDFRGVPGSKLNRQQIEVIGTRYNRGPELARTEIEQNLSNGQTITKRWILLNSLVR